MKKFFIVFILIGVFLSGCSNKAFFEFTFDNFYGHFFTESKYSSSKIDVDSFGYVLIQDEIIKLYHQIDKSDYKDSIIIIKKQTGKVLKQFVEDISKDNKIEGYKVDKTKGFELACNDERLPGYTINAKVVGNLTTIYLSHSFFELDGQTYIVSFSSDSEVERNTFSTDVKNIKCRK